MSSSYQHDDERGRLAALRRSGLLDTPPEERFDRITRLAARLFEAPISLITLVDEDRQYFKSRYGIDMQETSREVSFCTHMLSEEEPLIVESALHDPRFAANPLVTGPPGIRAYAGIPLRSPEDYVLGAFSVIDTTPRSFREDEIDLLSELADIVSDELSRSLQTITPLDKSHFFIERVLAAMPGVLYVYDLDQHQAVYVSQFASEVLGYSAEEISDMGRDVLATLVHPDDLGDLETWTRRFEGLEHGEVLEDEARVRHRDGSWRWLYSRDVVFRRDDKGRPRQILGIAVDITERKTYEEELLEAKQQAEATARLKGSILANMSHEIRTPLTAITGFCELLMEEEPEAVSEHVRPIIHNAQRLEETLTSVLDVARLEAEKFEVERKPIDVTEVVGETVEMLDPLAARKGIELDVNWKRTPLRARVDPAALRRIVNNLISNAIKFTDKGSVEVYARSEEDEIVVQVCDTGLGISEEFLPHVFEAFRQESSGDARSFEGSGLGLSITRKLVELMGGEIQVDSTKGEGSTFTVILPGDN